MLITITYEGKNTQELAEPPIELTATVYMLRCESDKDALNIFEPLYA